MQYYTCSPYVVQNSTIQYPNNKYTDELSYQLLRMTRNRHHEQNNHQIGVNMSPGTNKSFCID
jgi:hypothetical protein